MPKKRKKELIIAEHLRWLLGQRAGVYFADGRSNQFDAGRHSLGTRDKVDALEELKRLDRVKAVQLGMADQSILRRGEADDLPLSEGWRRYDEHVKRPRVAKGAKPGTAKRYRAVFEKFIPWANGQGIINWNQVTKQTLEGYAGWLDGERYAYATEYLELTTLKQAIKWLVKEKFLPKSCEIELSLSKPDETDTYCYTSEQVAAIVEHCRSTPDLRWLADVVQTLAFTGLRISELASLRSNDVDLEKNMILLKDESKSARRSDRANRETKGGYSRSFPIHPELRRVLDRLPKAQDGLLFHGPKGGVIKPDTVRNILIREVLKPLASRFPTTPGDVGFSDGRLHSFRHFFCSLSANGGVPEPMLMRWLGHRSSKMVRRYYHLHDEEAQRHMKKLSLSGEAGGAVAVGES